MTHLQISAKETSLSGPGNTFLVLTGSELRAGSSTFERVWHIQADGTLEPVSFLDRIAGIEWVASGTYLPAGMPPYQIDLEEDLKSSAVWADSLSALLRVTGTQGMVTYHLSLFPTVRGVRIERQTAQSNADLVIASDDGAHAPTGIEVDEPVDTIPSAVATDRIDGFALSPRHLRLLQVSFQDQTDHYNELVWEREWLLHTSETALTLQGCLFVTEDVLTNTGLLFLKEAPLPDVRPGLSGFDLEVSATARRITLHGEPDSSTDYPAIVIAYAGGASGRIAALHAYQRALRPYVAGRDGLLLSNTWGDRNRDARIHADFLDQEIKAGARLGVDIVQIDDGWQIGSTSNSVRAQTDGGVWEGFYAARDNFWDVNAERFPSGLAPLVDEAREYGMCFGLWFGPDSSNDFANARRDAEILIDLHRTLGIDYFKIDGVKVRTRTGERNLHAFFDYVLTESEGRITFDFDITAEVRPGYFGLAHVGPLFVENRYTDWHRYWPHQTLRNLWKLAHYIDPIRLRMEWLNNARHTDKYAGDPLAPNAYRPDYLFATVMFSSPLGWFEVSNLPETYFTDAAPLIAVWKEHREQIFNGTIIPIGNAPDGVAWTGFVSVTSDALYVLAFREFNPNPEWHITLPFVPNITTTVDGIRLGGDGDIQLLPDQTLTVSIPESRRFLFARIDLPV